MEWYDRFFGPGYLRRHEHLLDKELSSREVERFLELLKPSPGAKFLDVPCGFGRHALELARRGFNVTGVDLIPEQLEKARELMKAEGAVYPLIQSDMRKITFDGEFDFLINTFNGFGYFDEEGNRRTAENFRRALKPGGKLLVDSINRDGWLTARPFRYWHRLTDGAYLLEETTYDPASQRMKCLQITLDPCRSDLAELDCRLYSPEELADLFAGAGFKNPRILGADNGPLIPQALRFLLIMKKPLGETR